MKKILLAALLTIPLLSFAQEFTFYLGGKNLEKSTFKREDLTRKMKVSFLNNTKFKCRIASVLVIVGVPYSTNIVEQRSGSELHIYKEVVVNTSEKFSKQPAITFDLMNTLAKYPQSDCIFSFKVNEFVSDTDEGNNWIQEKLLFKEVALKMSISTNLILGAKGNH